MPTKSLSNSNVQFGFIYCHNLNKNGFIVEIKFHILTIIKNVRNFYSKN